MFSSPIDQFEKYRVPNRRALYTCIPIQKLETFRKVMKQYNVYFKIRFRGPRFDVPSSFRRSVITKQSCCLREDATTFSVYNY
jgi:hypothetical protein